MVQAMAIAVLGAAAMFGAASCTPSSPDHTAEDTAALLAIHAAGIQAHLDRDPEALTALETDTVWVGSRGELFTAARDERLEMRRGYLGSTRFHLYRDIQPPVVRVAGDRSIGWVLANVEMAGVQTNPAGREDSLGGIWTWIETYERRGGEWKMTGNVSTLKP
jgi:hypothetical protein